MRTILWTLAMALALALPAPAWASHMTHYRAYPVQHDDLGRSHEPDFAATSVLTGAALVNCVVDTAPFLGCGDDAAKTGRFVAGAPLHVAGYPGDELAPGCTGDAPDASPSAPKPMRVRSGLCALWSVGMRPANAAQAVPPHTVGEDGMHIPPDVAPGAFSPTKQSVVVLLDGRLSPTVSFNQWVPFGEAAADTGVAALQGLRGAYAYTYIPWAWVGAWRDLNGNGVIDHHTPGTAGPTLNEFVWYGACTDADGKFVPNAVALGICKEDVNPHAAGAQPCFGLPAGQACGAASSLQLYMYPGNHHGGEVVACAAGTQPCVTSDVPGNQAVNFALRLGNCEGPPSCDDDARAQTFDGGFGDPLLDLQHEVVPDDTLDDRTGDLSDVNRHWVGYGGNAGAAYDDGSIAHGVQVYAYNCAPSQAAPQKFDLATCAFVDVDVFASLSPALDAALNGPGGLKAMARTEWELVTFATPTIGRLADSVVNGRALYEAGQGPLTGSVGDASIDPGFSREPNHPLDQYPGVAWAPCPAGAWPSAGEAQHRGWCNAPAPDPVGGSNPLLAYGAFDGAANGGLFRGWSDHQLVPSVIYRVPVSLVADPCSMCANGPVVNSPLAASPLAAPPPQPGAHQRTLPPGQYFLAGTDGVWRDGAHTLVETVFPALVPDVQTYPTDGWVGFLARTNGQLRYRGYADVDRSAGSLDPLAACRTERDALLNLSQVQNLSRARAECNPYLDGNVQDPQGYQGQFHALLAPEEEFQYRCSGGVATLEPAEGVWATDLIVWRGHGGGFGPLIRGDGTMNPDWPFAEGGRFEFVQPGDTEPVSVATACFGGDQGWVSVDYLIWPSGNAGNDVVVRKATLVTLGVDLDGDPATIDADAIVDVDLYRAWRS